MGLFKSLRKRWQTMGIIPPSPNQIHSFNQKNLFFLLSLTMITISTIAFLIFQAKTLIEYGSCMFLSFADLSSLADVLISIWRIPIIFKMIEMCERFIEISEWETFSAVILNFWYSFFHLNRIEKWMEIECYVRWSDWKNRKNFQIALFGSVQNIIHRWPSCRHAHNFHQLFRSWHGRWFVSGCPTDVMPCKANLILDEFSKKKFLLFFFLIKATIQS